MASEPVIGYVPGVFDLFHIGHLNILKRARAQCDHLIAGVVIDDAVEKMKGYRPIVPFEERLEIVRSITYVDAAVTDTSRDKRVVWAEHRFDVIFKGSDWRDTDKGRLLEKEMAEVGASVIYLPYTQHTSSTMLRDVLTRLVQSL
ncbi:MAG: adenylyltransferase/cytidyltransferase family protein [Acidimicrobiales bacterium]|nr:adenylyltransferase/cytidyltransferase family protein [Acidimicrobiales bacterium]MCB9392604.1 adenylyltransferase/cytidyltransferase family protein [Acidimicrobiaceae bacterium]